MSENSAINIPVVSAILDPEPHSPPAGDWRDDDGAALDSYFESGDTSALLQVLVQAGKAAEMPKASRLIARSFVLTKTSTVPFTATQALNVDPNRTTLVIQTQKDTTKAGIYLAEQSFTVYDGQDAVGRVTQAFALPPNGQLVLPNYTGALWVASSDLAGTLSRVDVLAVTT